MCFLLPPSIPKNIDNNSEFTVSVNANIAGSEQYANSLLSFTRASASFVYTPQHADRKTTKPVWICGKTRYNLSDSQYVPLLQPFGVALIMYV